MPEIHLFLLLSVIGSALVFDYFNGINDSANAVATCVSTRALSLKTAVILAAVCNLLGALVSTKVALTIGKQLVNSEQIDMLTLLAGLLGSVGWSFLTWRFRIPSSSTHALMGGLVGATLAHAGFGAVNVKGLSAVVLALVLSPVAGLVLGFLGEIALVRFARHGNRLRLNKMFRRGQAISAAFVAFAHGTADAQKSMGIITLALFSGGLISRFAVPWPVMLLCALVISLGTAIGGWRIIKTVGSGFVRLQPVDGLCVQLVASSVILAASACGFPSSTTHVVMSAIVGTGLTRSFSSVNWKIVRNILCAWLFTIPCAALLAFCVHALLKTTIQLF